MTADAKVGLLLGLLFIAVIAFLVNDPSGFLRSDKPVIETAVPMTPGRIVMIDQAVSEVARELDPPLRRSEPPAEVRILEPYPAEPQTVSAQLSGGPASVPVAAVAEAAVLPSAGVPSIRSHTVQKGEHLASIAIRYYGREAGNKLATIRRLYEANSDILDSPDTVRVGDRLTIPDLEALTAPSGKPAAAEGAGFLGKLKDVFEPARASGRPAGNREYVVQQGDRLWEIAERFLGDGKRYPELVKANRKVLSDPDHVPAGVVLKIPAR